MHPFLLTKLTEASKSQKIDSKFSTKTKTKTKTFQNLNMPPPLVFPISNFFISKNSQGRKYVCEKSTFFCKFSFNVIFQVTFNRSITKVKEAGSRCAVGHNHKNDLKRVEKCIKFTSLLLRKALLAHRIKSISKAVLEHNKYLTLKTPGADMACILSISIKERSSERVDYDQFLPRNGLFGSLQRFLKH